MKSEYAALLVLLPTACFLSKCSLTIALVQVVTQNSQRTLAILTVKIVSGVSIKVMEMHNTSILVFKAVKNYVISFRRGLSPTLLVAVDVIFT